MDLFLTPFSFCFARALGIVAFLPIEVFSLGIGIKFVITFLLALCGMDRISNVEDLGILTYALEFMLGFSCVLPVLLLIHAADLWGDLYESLRGQSAGIIADPLFQGETSHVSLLFKNLMWVSLISIGVFESLINSYFRSYSISALNVELWQKSLLLITHVLTATLEMAMPFAIIFLTIELVSILSAKLLPSVSIQTEIFTVKMFLGFIGLVALLELDLLKNLEACLMRLVLF